MKKIDTTSGIYCFENLVNGKRYIGQGANLNRRYKRHLRELRNGKSPNKAFQRAWDKYGEENFKYYILEECSIEELDDKEIYYINLLESHCSKHGYNISFGGGAPMKGVEITEEHRRKLSIASSGENNAMYGKHPSEETLMKMSIALKGKVMSEESRMKSAFSQVGRRKVPGNSIYTGVRRDKCNCFWARIQNIFTKERLYLGYFRDEIDAAKAYDKKSWELYHNLLILNFPVDYIDMT